MMKSEGLRSPETTELAHALIQEGFDLPADVLTVDECADAIAQFLKSKKDKK